MSKLAKKDKLCSLNYFQYSYSKNFLFVSKAQKIRKRMYVYVNEVEKLFPMNEVSKDVRVYYPKPIFFFAHEVNKNK